MDYLEKDIDNNGTICTDSYGCIVNPVTKQSINSYEITIKKQNNVVTSSWPS